MMLYRTRVICAVACSLTAGVAAWGEVAASRPASQKPEPIRMLEIGAAAPDFDLPGVDGKRYRLNDFAEAKVLVIVFTCNHCPTAQAYEERIKKLTADYKDKGVALVAISPNDPLAVRLDELGYTDLNDSFEEMKIRAEHKEFNFPYLYDGETQEVSRRYGPPATPTVYIFDAKRRLRYVGRVDDSEREERIKSKDARNAIDALLAGQPVAVAKTRMFGCSTKWSDKRDTVVQAMKKLTAEPVSLDGVELKDLKEVMAGKTEKLRLVNFWATWCGTCVAEFEEFVIMSRMYRHRGFEFISVSLDFPEKKPEALAFLKRQEASNRNLLVESADPYEVIEAVDVEWNGALPYTALVDREGKVIYRRMGPIDPLKVRREIVKALGER